MLEHVECYIELESTDTRKISSLNKRVRTALNDKPTFQYFILAFSGATKMPNISPWRPPTCKGWVHRRWLWPKLSIWNEQQVNLLIQKIPTKQLLAKISPWTRVRRSTAGEACSQIKKSSPAFISQDRSCSLWVHEPGLHVADQSKTVMQTWWAKNLYSEKENELQLSIPLKTTIDITEEVHPTLTHWSTCWSRA